MKLQAQSRGKLNLWQTRHKLNEKSSKIVPLGAPFLCFLHFENQIEWLWTLEKKWRPAGKGSVVGTTVCLTGPRNLLGSARPMPCCLASHPQETRTRKSPFQCSCASPTKRRVPMDKRDRIPANNMRCPCSRGGAPRQSSKQNAHRVTHNSTLARPGAVLRAVLESYLQACCQIFV